MNIIGLTSATAIQAVLSAQVQRKGQDIGANFLTYRAPNGRRFNILLASDGCWLGESTPVGLRRVREGEKVSFVGDETIKQIMEENEPNRFVLRCRELGYDDAEVVRTYEGFDAGMAKRSFRKFKDLAQVAEVISKSLSANEWLQHETPGNRRDGEAIRRYKQQEEQIRQQLDRREQHSLTNEKGLFRGLFTMSGNLSREQKSEILSYINNPGKEGWEAICNMPVKGSLVLWDAIRRVDPSAPMMAGTGGQPYPGSEALRAYLRVIGETRASELLSPHGDRASLQADLTPGPMP